MKSIVVISFVFVILCLLTACAPTQVGTPAAAMDPTTLPIRDTSTPEPSATSAPSNTPLPSPTPEPTNTPLSEGILFRDDFEGEFQPGWEWENENPDKWAFTDDGWLQIIGEHDSLLGEQHQSNLLWYTLPEGDFAITVHLKTMPFENFHQSTIYIYEDPENFIALNRGYCQPCNTRGGGFYMEYKISGDGNAYMVTTKAEDVYLKLESKNNMISGYYAEEPGKWQRIGRFGNFFQFKKVGIGVTNVRAANDLVGLFDFFEISRP